jgi:hypothetical protein
MVSLSVISEANIPKKDVLFLYGRKFAYGEPPDITVVPLSNEQSDLLKIPSFGERFLALRRSKAVAEVDRLIEQFVEGEQFIAYLSSTRNFLMQLIATHPRCYSLAFIEEGLMTYTGEYYKQTEMSYFKNWLGILKRWIKFPEHLNRSYYYRPYHLNRPIPVYVIANGLHALPGFDVRVLSKIVSPPIDAEYKLEKAHILFMQPIVELGAASLQSILKMIDVLVLHLASQGIGVLWIKFHPAQEIEDAVIDHLNCSGVSYRVIPTGISAEAILLNSKDLVTYAINSSLLFYAVCWGHHSYSLSNVLEEIDPHFKLVYKTWHIPRIYFDKVPFL